MSQSVRNERYTLLCLSCCLGVLLLTWGFLRLLRNEGSLHTLLIQPTPMQLPLPAVNLPAPTAFEQKGRPAKLRALPGVSAPRSAPLNLPLDINAATVSELQSLPGVGPAMAQRIVRYREVNGAFDSADDLLKVKGIGPKTLDKIRPFVACGAR